MGEVANLRARAFYDLAIGGDEQIEFRRDRRDVARKGAFDSIRLAAADFGDAGLELPRGSRMYVHRWNGTT